MSTPPRSAIVQPGVAGQLVAGTHARGENDHAGVDDRAVAQRHPHRVVVGGPPDGPIALCRLDGFGADARRARRCPGRRSSGPAARRRPRRAVGPSAAAPSRRRGRAARTVRSALAASRPSRPPPMTTPTGAWPRRERALRVGADRVEVVEGAVDVAARQVVAGHRRHERVGAGGQHQRVVVDALAVGGDHRLGGAVDRGDPGAQPQLDAGRRRRSRCRAARAGRGPSARCSRSARPGHRRRRPPRPAR